MEQWDKIGLLFLGLFNFGWMVYAATRKTKQDESAAQITDRAQFTKDVAQMLKEAVEAKEKLEVANAQSLININKLDYENNIYKHKNELLESAVASFREDVKKLTDESLKLKEREAEFDRKFEEFRESRNERIEIEHELKRQNIILQGESDELRNMNRELIASYEKSLGEKERQIKTLLDTSKKQGKAIETMKEILAANGLTANVEL